MKHIQLLSIFFGLFFCVQIMQAAEGVASAAGRTWGQWLKGKAAHLAEKSTEYANMAFDMGMPMGVGMAASQANEFLSEEQAAVFEDFQLEQDAITNGLKSWSAKQSALITKQMNTVSSYFKNQLAAINTATSNVYTVAQNEANYLFQNVSLAQPPTALVSYAKAGVFDEWFATGIMATPASKYLWYNYFIAGDWLFDPTTNSFWQNQAVPCSSSSTPFDPKKPDPTTVGVLSSNNIFVEYYPSTKPYTISGSFTLYTISYPFFAGIMFNKNRWISGNSEGEHKCRLLGIYATSTSDASVYFAEQYELSNKDALKENAKKPTPIKKPLFQIVNGHVQPLVSISEKIMLAAKSEPITFNFKITTNPKTVSFKLWAATDKEPNKEILLQNLDESFYLYHTLGFMSPGVATEWKLTAPKELTFSPQAIVNFKNTVFPSKN